jgi:hypothetical protein
LSGLNLQSWVMFESVVPVITMLLSGIYFREPSPSLSGKQEIPHL